MALQSSRSISFSQIAQELGGSAPHSISEVFRTTNTTRYFKK